MSVAVVVAPELRPDTHCDGTAGDP